MKHKRYDGGSSAGESSEDEMIINPEEPLDDRNGRGEEEDDWDVFENSQDLTQVLPPPPQRSIKVEPKSPKKKKNKKEKRRYQDYQEEEEEEDVSFTVPSPSKSLKRKTGSQYGVREVEVSEIPERLISSLTRLLPKDFDCSEGLTAEDVATAANSSKGGVCIFQCPQNISLSDLLTGKKILLDEGRFVLEDEDEDNPELTQYAGADSLGNNVRSRRLEAVSVTDGPYMGGTMLVLPESNSFKMVTVPVDRHLIIREIVEELPLPKIKIKRSKPRELPTGIKERHPVYGADFTEIIQKMEAASSEPPSKKKKKSRASDNNDNSTITSPNYWKSINQNRFLDNSSDYVPYTDKEILAQEEITSSKKKKKRKNKHGEMEEPALDETVNGNGDSWLTTDNSYEDAEEHGAEKRSKKSKKHKRKEVEDSLDLDQTEILLNSNDAVVKKRKKSKHRE